MSNYIYDHTTFVLSESETVFYKYHANFLW